MRFNDALFALAGSGGAPALTLPTAGLIAAWDARVGVTESGGKVSSWVDTAGTYDAVQAGPGAQPTLVSVGIGGKSVIRFASADSSRLVASLSDATTSWTVYAVIKATTTGTEVWWATGSIYLANRVGHLRLHDGASRVLGASVDTAEHVSCVVLDGVTSHAQHYLDGSADGAGVTYTPRAIVSPLSIGASDTGVFPADIDYASLVIYDGAHDLGERNAVHAYITQEWGV